MKHYKLAVHSQQFTHTQTIESLGTHFDPLKWVEDACDYPKFFWKGKENQLLAGCGSLLTLTKAPHFQEANTSPALFFGGQAFNKTPIYTDNLWSCFPRSCYFLPRKQIVQEGDEYFLITNHLEENNSQNEQDREIPLSSSFSIAKVGMSPRKEEWTRSVSHLLKSIQKNKLTKAVLARRSDYSATGTIDPYEILKQLKHKKTILFFLAFAKDAAFIGSTPERLFLRDGSSLTTEAVAGTRPRGDTEENDLHLENELLTSPKDIHEFSLVKHSIYDALITHCTKIQGQDQLQICKTPHVQHLFAQITASLKNTVDDQDLIDSLHPTAAIGGWPKQEALNYLFTHEPIDRGWYASPLGYVSQKKTELCVAIRSCLVKKESIHSFVGAGIVKGSDAEKEWEELNQKEIIGFIS